MYGLYIWQTTYKLRYNHDHYNKLKHATWSSIATSALPAKTASAWCSCSTWKLKSVIIFWIGRSTTDQFLIFGFLKIPDVFLVVPIKIPMSHHILWVSAPATSEKKTKPIALARQPLAPPFHMTGRASQWYQRNFPRVASQRSGGRLKLLLLCFAVGSMQVGNRRHKSEIPYNVRPPR